jgi:hypothetical protein
MHNSSKDRSENIREETTSVPEHLLKLAEGFSTQTKTATKYWLTLAVISVLVILPNETNTLMKIPFELGTIKQADFFPFSAFLISILIIGFGSAHVQAIRSRSLIQRVIDDSGDKYLLGKIHLRDFIDSIVSPSITRTAPLAQYLRGKYQFYPESKDSSRMINIISTLVYLLLKVAALFVVYLMPAFALTKSIIISKIYYVFNQSSGIPNILFLFIFLIAAFILLELVVSEILYIITSIHHITKKTITE